MCQEIIKFTTVDLSVNPFVAVKVDDSCDFATDIESTDPIHQKSSFGLNFLFRFDPFSIVNGVRLNNRPQDGNSLDSVV